MERYETGDGEGNAEYWPSIAGRALDDGILLSTDRFQATATRNNANGKVYCEVEKIPLLNQQSHRIEQLISGIPIIRGTYEGIVSVIIPDNNWKRHGVTIIISVLTVLAAYRFTPQFSDNIRTMSHIGIVSILGMAIVGLILAKVCLLVHSPGNKGIIAAYFRKIKVLKNIYNTLRYHGAEHKVLNYYESPEFTQYEKLSLKTVKKYSIVSDECGSSFVALYTICLIIYYLLTDWFGSNSFINLMIFPLVYGIACELFILSEDWPVLAVPGRWLQKHFFTVEPDNEQIEVATKALVAILQAEDDKGDED